MRRFFFLIDPIVGEKYLLCFHIVATYEKSTQTGLICISIHCGICLLSEGLSRNVDGYYRLEDNMGRFDNTITEFENLAKEYGVSD